MNHNLPIMRVENLSAEYEKQVVLSNISFSLNRGEILCIVGESGSGKSTVLKSILGDPEVKITEGKIYLENNQLVSLPKKKRRKISAENIGIIFQNPGASFNPIRSFKSQFIEAMKSHGLYDSKTFLNDVDRIFKSLELDDSESLLKSCPYEMSGGMNQRISIALAMLLGQKILLADEPTSALDAVAQLQTARELKMLRNEKNISQIIVTHNLGLARFLADKIAVIQNGRIIEYGPADQIFYEPQSEYTKMLAAAVPRIGDSI